MLLDGFSIASVESVLLFCVRVDIMGTFPFPKTLRNFHGKVHRVKKVFHLTQVPFVYALVTKIQDGGTDIALNSIELVIPCKNS